MRKRVVAAGHICLDITPAFLPGSAFAYAPGTLMEVGDAAISSGGAAANTGLAFQRFGCDATLMGRLGDDPLGGLLRAVLEAHGVEDAFAVSPGDGTAYTIVLAPPGSDRMFLHFAGANHSFGLEDIDFARVAGADLFHFGYPPLMRRLYEGGGEELARMYRQVKALGVATSLDLAAVDAASPAGRADWREILQRVMPYVDFFVPSAEELCFMIDRPRYDGWLTRAAGQDVTGILDPETDIRPLAEEALAWGAKAVLIKCGAPGMYLRTAREAAEIPGLADGWASFDRFEPGYVAPRFCSGTGAGDASIAAFLTGAIQGHPPARCLQLATAAGACCVTAYDALGGLIPLEEMAERIDAGWPKQTR